MAFTVHDYTAIADILIRAKREVRTGNYPPEHGIDVVTAKLAHYFAKRQPSFDAKNFCIFVDEESK